MQEQVRPVVDLLKTTKERLDTTEKERDRALDELQEMKRLAQDANMRLSETISTRKVADISTEFNTLVQELKNKNKDIELLRDESAKSIKELEIKLAHKDASVDSLKQSLSDAKSMEAHAMNLHSECHKRLQELEPELEERKESEKKMLDSFVSQTKQLEQTMISFQESKLEVESLREKLNKLEGSSGKYQDGLPGKNHEDLNASQTCLDDTNETLGSLKSKLLLARTSLAQSQENEKASSLKIESLLEEVSSLKNELRLLSEAEENNKKAMDDLALALKEVGLESSHVKEELAATEAELDYAKSEAEELRLNLKTVEDKYKAQLDELKKEADRHRNTAERLRLEAEESLLAWSVKETEFVNCIKRAEEERNASQEENSSLLELLREAENMVKTAKEENVKVRDILKQAINEANVAKEASGIARQENSQLKDDLLAKEEALKFISKENENLKVNEAAALESIKELKRLLAESSARESKVEDKEQGKKLKSENSLDKEHKDANKLPNGFHINIKEVKIPRKHKDHVDWNTHENANEDAKFPNKHRNEDFEGSSYVDALEGSIFEVNSPGSAAHHLRKSSIAFSDDGKTITTEELDSVDWADSDGDRSTRKKKALIRRFGDIVMRRGTHNTHNAHNAQNAHSTHNTHNAHNTHNTHKKESASE